MIKVKTSPFPFISDSTLDTLNQILCSDDHFSFVSQKVNGIKRFKCRGAKIQIQDGRGIDLMSTLGRRGRICLRSQDDPSGDLTQFLDGFNNILLETRRNGTAMTVSTGSLTLGTLEGMESWNLSMTVKDADDQPLLKILPIETTIDDGDLAAEYRILRHYGDEQISDMDIGRIYTTNTPFLVQFSQQNLDPKIKANAFIAAFIIFSKHHVKRNCGVFDLKYILLGGLCAATLFGLMLVVTYILSLNL